jgi:hypothetical protein
MATTLRPGETEALGNISQATILAFNEEYAGAEAEVKQAGEARRGIRNRIKAAGIRLKAWDKMQRDLQIEQGVRDEEERHYRYLMAAVSEPVAYENGHDREAPPLIEVDGESIAARMKRIDGAGYDLGRAGEDARNNPHPPGSEEHMRWLNAWTRGQADKVSAEISESSPPQDTAARRVSRGVRGSRNRPRRPRQERLLQ